MQLVASEKFASSSTDLDNSLVFGLCVSEVPTKKQSITSLYEKSRVVSGTQREMEHLGFRNPCPCGAEVVSRQ